jgi:hypothetical protein
MAHHLEESLQRAMDLIRAKVTEMAALGERALKEEYEQTEQETERQHETES